MSEPETLYDRIAAILAERDPNGKPTDDGWAAQAFLLASATLGPDPEAIVDALGMDPIMAGVFSERARRSGIWTVDGVQTAPWEEEDGGGVKFAMDASILVGDIERVGPDSYSMTEEGRRRVERMIGAK